MRLLYVRRVLRRLVILAVVGTAIGGSTAVPVGAPAADMGARIVGPQPPTTAVQAEWPFMAYVQVGAGACGGSVVAARWVITAAHCAVFDSAASTFVWPGAYRLSTRGAPSRVDASLVHPSYSSVTEAWDFALLRLSSPTSSPAVTLPTPADSTAFADALTGGATSYVAGWGSSNDADGDPYFPDVLLHAPFGVPLISDGDCATTMYPSPLPSGATFLAGSMICAGNSPQDPSAAYPNYDTCQGDSGGPLVLPLNGRRVLAGLTSWGDGCGETDSPGVYARVPAALDWICDTVTSPVAITATPGTGSASVAWTPDSVTCPWRDPVVAVTAGPNGATVTAPLSSGGLTVTGLAPGTVYTVTARVRSTAGATPPAAVATVTTTAPPPPPPGPEPCTQTFYQQAARTWRVQASPGGVAAVRVVSRIRIYEDAPLACRTSLTFIFRDARTKARLSQLPGSTLGYRKLTGKDFSAPVVSWPVEREFRFAGSDPTGLARRDARLVLVSYLRRTRAMPAQPNVELAVVRRIPRNPLAPVSAANPVFAQVNAFGIPVSWAAVS